LREDINYKSMKTKIFVSNKGVVNGKCKVLDKEKLCDLHRSPSFVSIIQYRRLR